MFMTKYDETSQQDKTVYPATIADAVVTGNQRLSNKLTSMDTAIGNRMTGIRIAENGDVYAVY